MGYNPFCQYYRHQGIPQPPKPRAGLQSLFSTHPHQEMIRIHECYHPENLDAAGKLHSASWTCDKKIDCQFKRVPSKG
jgi:hypothetical protein